jgi:hypothetical protein
MARVSAVGTGVQARFRLLTIASILSQSIQVIASFFKKAERHCDAWMQGR